MGLARFTSLMSRIAGCSKNLQFSVTILTKNISNELLAEVCNKNRKNSKNNKFSKKESYKF